MKIEVLHHATIKIITDKIIYFDPYDINEDYHDADYIFITHDHYDHYDSASIKKVKKSTTKIILPKNLKLETNSFEVEPYKSYTLDNLKFETIPSYNINKEYHPKEKAYLGYNLFLQNKRLYVMGDTDRTPEADKVKTDICFVPIGGEYTMNVDEATAYINDLKPKKAIPIHYGKIIGNINLGEEFKSKINKNIEVELFINRR